MTLSQKLNEIKFPHRVPNSPYSIKSVTPATPITQMMEFKNWLKQSINRVCMNTEKDVSRVTFEFIAGTDEER